MIDFRYHIVSIVAIFIALAVGIVLGSGPLKDDISGFLEARTAALAKEKVALQGDITTLRDAQSASQQYASLVQPNVLRSLLLGQPVALVLLPDGSKDTADQVTTAVEQAGGSVTERVELRKEWMSPDQRDALAKVAGDLVRRGGSNDPYELAAAALAGALVTDNERLIGQPYTPSGAILGALKNAGFLRVPDGVVMRAGSAIVVGSDETSASNTDTLLPLIDALDAESQGEVLGAPLASTQPGGVVAAVRDSDSSSDVSTVDTVDQPQGVTVSVLALVDNRNGVVGHYGFGKNVDGPAPDPVPSN